MPEASILSCPHCNNQVAFELRLAGQNVTCPHCNGLFQMPVMTTKRKPPPSSPTPSQTPPVSASFDFQTSEQEPLVRKPRRNGRPVLGTFGWTVLAILLVVGLTIPFIILTWKPSYPEPAFRVTADDWVEEFDENPIAFKARYEGKVIEVTGFWEHDRFRNTPGVSLVGEKDYKRSLHGELSDRPIQCDFPKDKTPTHSVVMTIRGICRDGDLYLVDCVVEGRDRPYRPVRKPGGSNKAVEKLLPRSPGVLTVEDLSKKRKEICDKHPLQAELANDEWINSYRWKVVNIAGIIERIKEEGEGGEGKVLFCVSLRSDKNAIEFVDRPVSEGGSYTREGVSGVTCFFSANKQAELATLRTGQAIAIRGTFDPSSSTLVVLKNCSLIK